MKLCFHSRCITSFILTNFRSNWKYFFFYSRIETILGDRCSASDKQKVDTELQFNILMLSEVISVKMLSVLPHRPSSVLFQHIDKLCQVFDKILVLDLKDEYEVASNALENLLFNIVHMRPLQNYYTSKVISRFTKNPRSESESLKHHRRRLRWGRKLQNHSVTLFENHPKCRIWIFQFWHFSSIFVLLKLTCLVTLFDP